MFETIEMIENSIVSYADAMKILAGDVQNFQADGYKQTRYSFVSIFQQKIAKYGGASGQFPGADKTQSLSQGVVMLPMGVDFTQGGLRGGGPLNVAIQGQGLFALKTQNMSDFIYTRASDFVFGSDGTLVDSFGRKVMGYKMVNGEPDKTKLVTISVDPSTVNTNDIGFENNGILTTNYQARKQALESSSGNNDIAIPEGETLFQIAVANIPNPSGLTPHVGNTYRTNLTSGSVTSFSVSNEGAAGTVIGGSAESSNVNPAETTIIGIQLQRGYNAVQGALSMINKMLSSFMSVVDKG